MQILVTGSAGSWSELINQELLLWGDWRVLGFMSTRGRHLDHNKISPPQLTFLLITKFLHHSSHSSWFLLYVRGALWRLAGERTITGLSLGPDWTEDWWQTVNNIVYALCLLSGICWNGAWPFQLLFGLHLAHIMNNSIFDIILCLGIHDVFCFGTALEQCCNVAAGLTGLILLALCFIDFSAMQHYAEHGSGDCLWSVP